MRLFENLQTVEIRWTACVHSDSRLARLTPAASGKQYQDDPSFEQQLVALDSLSTLKIEVSPGKKPSEDSRLESMKQLRSMLPQFNFATLRDLDLRFEYSLALFASSQSSHWKVDDFSMPGLKAIHLSCKIAVKGPDADFDLHVSDAKMGCGFLGCSFPL